VDTVAEDTEVEEIITLLNNSMAVAKVDMAVAMGVDNIPLLNREHTTPHNKEDTKTKEVSDFILSLINKSIIFNYLNIIY
jgi:hypothetical protein